MAPRLRQALGGLPWLDLLFDGQRETNIKTRLEAFMHQASQVARQRGHKTGSQAAALLSSRS